MPYKVLVKPKVLRRIPDLPQEVQAALVVLEEVLSTKGPTGPHGWTNYGLIRGKKNQRLYHCHLSKDHQYVACWEYYKEAIQIEIYYAGSHPSGKYPTNRP